MGNGFPRVTDDGTIPRIDFGAPGPIGLDAKHGKQPTASLGDQVLAYSRRQRGQRVGNGECFALADRALHSAGARSAADYGNVSPNADYVWGTPVSLTDVQPGDVIQFRDYRYERVVETRHSDGSVTTDEDFQERPHHTAIVERVGTNGEITILEQNSPIGSAVVRNTLFFVNRAESSDERTTRITVHGTFWVYRAQPR